MNELDLKILKVICTDVMRAVDFANSYTAELFEDNRVFAGLAIKYIKAFRSPPTERTLTEWSKSYGELIDSTFLELDFQYDLNEYSFDLENFKNRYAERIISEINEISSSSSDPERVAKDISIRIQKIRTVKEGKSFTQKTVKEFMPEFNDLYEARESNESDEIRIKTGYSAIDYAVGGFRPAELFLLGGETGAGKSMFLLNIAIQMWMQGNNLYTENFAKGYNISYFSLEMPYEDMFTRFLARMAEVPERLILDGELTDEHKARIDRVQKFIDKYPYQFDIIDAPRKLTIEEIEMRFQDAKLKYEPQIAIIDYMGLMSSPRLDDQQDWLKMGGLAGELHEFARTHKVIVGSALQLTDIQRGSKQDKKDKSQASKVGGHRIGRSSQILHHANFYAQIDTRDDEEKYPDLIYHVVKNRRGPAPKNISIYKNFSHSHLRDIPYISPEKRNMDSTNGAPDISNAINAAREKLREMGRNDDGSRIQDSGEGDQGGD